MKIICELKNTKQEVLIRFWEKKYNRIKDILESFNSINFKIKILSFTSLKSHIGDVYCYNINHNKF